MGERQLGREPVAVWEAGEGQREDGRDSEGGRECGREGVRETSREKETARGLGGGKVCGWREEKRCGGREGERGGLRG